MVVPLTSRKNNRPARLGEVLLPSGAGGLASIRLRFAIRCGRWTNPACAAFTVRFLTPSSNSKSQTRLPSASTWISPHFWPTPPHFVPPPFDVRHNLRKFQHDGIITREKRVSRQRKPPTPVSVGGVRDYLDELLAGSPPALPPLSFGSCPRTPTTRGFGFKDRAPDQIAMPRATIRNTPARIIRICFFALSSIKGSLLYLYCSSQVTKLRLD